MLKIVGVLLIGLSLPDLTQLAATIVQISQRQGVGLGGLRTDFWISFGIQSFGYLFQFGLGIYLIAGGEWLVSKCIPSNRPYCPECGYDLSNSSTDWCAECGIDLTHLFAERIKNRRVVTPQSSEDSGGQQHGDNPKQEGDQSLQ